MWLRRKFLITILLVLGPSSITADTDPTDVSALGITYTSLNLPKQLTKWTANGGDPCGESWKGITCSGSKVTEIKLSGLGLNGSMGYQLTSLTSLTTLDLSNNILGDEIPYALPPNLQQLILTGCGFSGDLPYSISEMSSLEYINLSHNKLQGELQDMFGSLSALSTLDLSFNSLKKDLPQSLSSLSKITNMYLQNNQFTGTIDVLANLPLRNLNIENNNFSGWIPDKLKKINIQKDGNSWSSGPAPPPPAGDTNSSGILQYANDSKKLGMGGAGVASIINSILFVGPILFSACGRTLGFLFV